MSSVSSRYNQGEFLVVTITQSPPPRSATVKPSKPTQPEPKAEAPREVSREWERLNSLLQTLTNNLPAGVLVEDERVILHANQKFCDLFGIPNLTLIVGTDCADAARAASSLFVEAASFAPRIEGLLAAGKACKGEELALVDGRTFERDYVPVLLQGNVRGHLWQYRDVTDRKRAEVERLKAVEQTHELERLREIDRFKTDFIAMAAHDLGASIQLIKYELGRLQGLDEQRPGEDRDRALAVLGRNVDRVGQFVDEMLEAVRLQSSRLEIQPVSLDLPSLILESVDSFHEAAKTAEVVLEVRVPEMLCANADPRRVKQIMYNLLSNATNFTPPRGCIIVEAQRGMGVAVVSVRDSGVGLNPDQIARLFHPFSQVHHAKPRGRAGTGLGLYISKGIAELQGGKMWCESPGEGRGSTFHFTIPLVEPEVAPPPPPKQVRSTDAQ